MFVSNYNPIYIITLLYLLCSTQTIGFLLFKVHILREGHKILQNLKLSFDTTNLVMSKLKYGDFVELVSKELAAILHVYARGFIFMK